MRKDTFVYCLYCGASPVEWHHVILRSQGGEDGPQIPLCRQCHDRRHDERLRIEMDGADVRFTDLASGEIVTRHLTPQLASAGSQLVEEARAIHHWLDVVTYSGKLREEPDEVLSALYDDIRTLKHRAWMAQAAIINEMQGRSSYGDHMAEHVAKALGCNARTVQSRGQIFREIIVRPEAAEACEVLGEEGFYKEACSAPNPVAAINLAKERKTENPRYSVAQFREELHNPNDASRLRRVVLVTDGESQTDQRIAAQIERKYGVPVVLVQESDANGIPDAVIRPADGYFRSPSGAGNLRNAVSR
jgi:hypothetical protein